ncbi:xanthine dehydrogenase family protein molybdopterin-binding subunit [Fertoebacter nigrum]|uniref:Xanthine dehydrogenase family protein molybdopterin-binding subunit n=1 Tax=Fertoeibacter niger TaxID=2656921 RepID=A0A8X8H0Q3_9RHOB|nr:xanthine dehydrogenase family protein molybdopterin-binding subunit [Fertoeibacter niger]NUB44981.1 xanthine dehydrogenase family protein molybdopterin-binding subunit [Fertoeibacter niger]
MTTHTFPDRARVDALDKVRGATQYAADVAVDRMTHAMTVPSEIVKGRLVSVDVQAARAIPGVLRVLTYQDFQDVAEAVLGAVGPYSFRTYHAMLSDRLIYRGEPIALVVAETLEIAIEAAALVTATYAPDAFSPNIDAEGTEVFVPEGSISFGDFDQAFDSAAVTIEAEYNHAAQHQNPMELISTTADFRGGHLYIHEGSQSSGAIKFGVALSLGLDPERVHVMSPTVGGGFGQKNSMQQQTVLVARAAMLIGRPVKLVLPRGQIFHMATYRPVSRHRIRLGLDAAGKIVAASYDGQQQNSRAETFRGAFSETAARIYAIANYRSSEQLIRTDTQSPGFMRAPFEHPASFAFESAIDELAHAAGLDPVALRLANQAETDPVTGLPFTSRHLVECLTEGARRFGWDDRSPAIGSMQDADGLLIGYGVGVGCYKAATSPVIARLRVSADGRSRISLSGHEMGQGMRNVIVAALVARLDIDPQQLEVIIGEPDGAPQHVTAGSWGTASVVPAVEAVADEWRRKLDDLRDGRSVAGNVHQVLFRLKRPYIDAEVQVLAPGQPVAVMDRLRQSLPSAVGPQYPEFVGLSFSAHFVEVRVEPSTRRIRVSRVVSVIDCGTVMSPRTAESQVYGGVIWGIAAALREISEQDPRYGGVLNNDLADYVVPVNADIGAIDVSFVNKPDPLLNAAGVKGLGEVAMVGVAAAIANAVHHATGKRIRSLPIRIEDVL